MNFKISIPYNCTDGNEAIFAYIQSYCYNGATTGHSHINIQCLELDLNINAKTIRTSVRNMISAKILHAEEVSANIYKVYADSFSNYADEYYSVLNFADIVKIMQCDFRNRLNLAHYYVCVCRTINWHTKIGSCAIDTLANKSGLNSATVMRYNKELEKLHIIYINHNHTNDLTTNKYGLWENRAAVDAKARECGTYSTSKSRSNDRRRIKQMYNAAVGGKKYTESELRKLLGQITIYNEEMYELENTHEGGEYLKRLINPEPVLAIINSMC